MMLRKVALEMGWLGEKVEPNSNNDYALSKNASLLTDHDKFVVYCFPVIPKSMQDL